MKKTILLTTLIIVLTILNSCMLGGCRIFFDNDDKIADKRMEQVMKAIKSQDREALKATFSKQALAEADDFDGHMDYLFEFFQGEIQLVKRDGKPPTDEDFEYGKRSKMIRSFFDVTTDKGKYVFFLLDYPVDTIHPDNAGLYTLCG